MRVDRTALLKKGVLLEYGAIGWNVVAVITAVAAGIVTDSIALVGFGLDSIIVSVSSGMVLWRLHLELEGEKSKDELTITERRVLFVSGVVFFLLSLYIMNESGSKLYYKEKSDESIVGLVLSIVSLIAMPVLAVTKLRVSKAMESRTLRDDAIRTAIFIYLSVMLFLGLGLRAWLGWWWADPIAALLMVPLIVRGGWEAIEESKGSSSSGTVKTDS
jgi:divalent metal cation (Fe/Co/Zn/Cd) transporter